MALLDGENLKDAYLAYEAGIIEHRREVAVSSECAKEGIKITDVAEDCRVFLGFSQHFQTCETVTNSLHAKKGWKKTLICRIMENKGSCGAIFQPAPPPPTPERSDHLCSL